jgi:hypothetical protein
MCKLYNTYYMYVVDVRESSSLWIPHASRTRGDLAQRSTARGGAASKFSDETFNRKKLRALI